VVTLESDRVVLNSGGFRTNTTKSRINEHQSAVRLWQEKGYWFCSNDRGTVDFYDGITFSLDGKLVSEKRDQAARKQEVAKTKRAIGRFVTLIDGMEKLPVPSTSDCLFCLADFSMDCLESHVSEGYLHGSLIARALKDRGYRDPGVILAINAKDLAKRALRRYLVRHLIKDVATN